MKDLLILKPILKKRMAKVQKIILFGAESTGKSTLAQQLATHYGTIWSPEFARIYLHTKHQISLREPHQPISVYQDIAPMAIGQMGLEDHFSAQAKDFFFCDTNLLTNLIYSHYYFGKAPLWLSETISLRTYNLYLLLDIDVAWESDPLRDRPDSRAEVYGIFKKTLLERKQNFVEISGLGSDRLKNAICAIEKFWER